MELLRQLWAQVTALWQSMSLVIRALVIGVGIALVLGLGLLSFLWFRTDYQPLRSGLSAEESTAITGRLQARNIPFRTEAGGATILVPADRLSAANVEVAGSGISGSAGKGFEVFDESPLGMTPFVQNVNYIRALQSELARSISQLDPVAQARVHIVRPEPTPFLREQKPTTASVVLKLKPGRNLNRSMSDAIIALVARAVEGLSPEQVTVVDTRGRLLSESQAPEERVTSGQLESRRQLEAYLASKAEDMLRRHLGVNRAIVRVAAETNFQRLKEKSESFGPERIATAERQTTQKSTGAAGGPRGVVGATTNVTRAAVGAGAGGGAAGGGGTTSSEVNQTDYSVSKVSRELENQLNNIARLTVAAMVDLSGTEEGKKLTLIDAQELIKQAIGFKETRDEIKVTDVSLAPKVETEDEEATRAQQERVQMLLRAVQVGSLVVGLLLVVVLIILVVQRLRAARAAEAAPVAQPTPAPTPTPQPTPEEVAVEDFQKLAESDPERAARVLQLLLETGA
jgi:flagellar M-ring protein FliF